MLFRKIIRLQFTHPILEPGPIAGFRFIGLSMFQGSARSSIVNLASAGSASMSSALEPREAA